MVKCRRAFVRNQLLADQGEIMALEIFFLPAQQIGAEKRRFAFQFFI